MFCYKIFSLISLLATFEAFGNVLTCRTEFLPFRRLCRKDVSNIGMSYLFLFLILVAQAQAQVMIQTLLPGKECVLGRKTNSPAFSLLDIIRVGLES